MCKSLFLALVISLTMSVPTMAAPVITVGFSPSDDHSALKVVLIAISGAKRSIDVAAYSFTSKPVAMPLAAASQRIDRVTRAGNGKGPQRTEPVESRILKQGQQQSGKPGQTFTPGPVSHSRTGALRGADSRVGFVRG